MMLEQCPVSVGFDYIFSQNQMVLVHLSPGSTKNMWLLRRGSLGDGRSGQGSLKGWHQGIWKLLAIT